MVNCFSCYCCRKQFNHKDSSPLTSTPKKEVISQVTTTEAPKPTEDPTVKKAADKKAKANAEAKAKADAKEKAPHLNEKAAVGNLIVNVSKDIQSMKSIGDQFHNQTAQGIYWTIPVAIMNNYKKSRMIDTSMFQLISEMTKNMIQILPQACMETYPESSFYKV